MDLPPKPELERRTRTGQFGELIEELTPESEQRWAQYLTTLQFAKAALVRREDGEES